jgi:gamma-glutamylaminecyclotransferase
MRGEQNHYLMGSAQFLRESRTKPIFQLRNLGDYPGLVPGGTSSVVGELYELDDGTLAVLDQFEEHPDFYERKSILLADGSTVETYLLRLDQVQGCCVIPSGSWRAFSEERYRTQSQPSHALRPNHDCPL